MKNLHFPDFLNYSLKCFVIFFLRKKILLFNLVQTLWNINFVQVLLSLKLLTRLNFNINSNVNLGLTADEIT